MLFCFLQLLSKVKQRAIEELQLPDQPPGKRHSVTAALQEHINAKSTKLSLGFFSGSDRMRFGAELAIISVSLTRCRVLFEAD